MRRPVILGGNPYIVDSYRKATRALFDETGGNTGNLAFLLAVTNHIPNARHLHWGATAQQVRAAGDVIILPLANQLGRHTDLGQHAARLADFDLPVIGLGLGAQSATDKVDIQLTFGTEEWLRTMARLSPSGSPNIGVRGAYTKDQIARIGLPNAAVVTGCPSNFINLTDDIAASIAKGFQRKPQRIAVTAGIPYTPALAGIERNLADMVSLTGGAYVVQHGLQMVQIARNGFNDMDAETLEVCRQYSNPLLSLDEYETWCRRHAFVFWDARAWMEFLRGFDFVIGTRFHGAMLAMQAGVPAACIAHDSRTQEMCETMGVPVRHHTEIRGALTLHNVLEYFQFDAPRYRQMRQDLCRNYVKIFDDADVQISPALRKFQQQPTRTV